MNRRGLLSGFLVVVCLATLWGVWGQRSQLAGLRAEHQPLLAQLPTKADRSGSGETVEATGANSEAPPQTLTVTPELLRLRNEVTRLTERRRELAGVRAENERLRAQLVSRGTNDSGGSQLPAGYVRKSEARWVGYGTPEATLQSLLWAVQNHDLTNVLQAFTPEIADQLRAHAGESAQSTEDFWNKSAGLVGLRVVNWERDESNGSINVEVEVLPGMPPDQITFEQINGQWKVASHF